MNRSDDHGATIDVAHQDEQIVKFKGDDQSITDYFQELEEKNLQALNDKIQKIQLNFMQDSGLDLKACLDII